MDLLGVLYLINGFGEMQCADSESEFFNDYYFSEKFVTSVLVLSKVCRRDSSLNKRRDVF